MSQDTITYLEDVYLLTCVVQNGLSDIVVQAARDSGAATGALIHKAKGTGLRERLGILGVAVETEREVIKILVSADQRDHVFNSIFKAAELNIPARGYISLTELEKVSTYIPDNILAEIESSEP